MRNITIFAMGPGESTQAYGLIKHLLKTRRDLKVTFCLRKQINYSFFKELPVASALDIRLTGDPKSLFEVIKETNSELLLLCNSKAFSKHGDFIDKSPIPEIPTYCLDSNWLFNPNNSDFPFISWAKKYLVNIPKPIFELGLNENGGYFNIPNNYKQKLKPIGLIPSYEKLNNSIIEKTREELLIPAGEKYIFCYFSGFGADSRSWVLINLLNAISTLRYREIINIRYLGIFPEGMKLIETEKCSIIGNSTISPEDFFRYLSAADLVFQHQGLGTLAQAISAQVPVIANVAANPSLKGLSELHMGEVSPFDRFGACKIHDKEDDKHTIAKSIDSYLNNQKLINQIQSSQAKVNVPGEEALAKEIGL